MIFKFMLFVWNNFHKNDIYFFSTQKKTTRKKNMFYVCFVIIKLHIFLVAQMMIKCFNMLMQHFGLFCCTTTGTRAIAKK